MLSLPPPIRSIDTTMFVVAFRVGIPGKVCGLRGQVADALDWLQPQ